MRKIQWDDLDMYAEWSKKAFVEDIREQGQKARQQKSLGREAKEETEEEEWRIWETLHTSFITLSVIS